MFYTDGQLDRAYVQGCPLHGGVPRCASGCLDTHATPNQQQLFTQQGSPVVQLGKFEAVTGPTCNLVYMFCQEHMSRPKGGEGASDCVHDVLVEVLSIALPYMDCVLREKRVVVCHTTTTHRLH